MIDITPAAVEALGHLDAIITDGKDEHIVQQALGFLDTGFVVRITGVTFAEGWPAGILRCEEMLNDGSGRPVTVRLIPVPSNKHDPNAIAVVCVAAGGRIGWIPKDLAARLKGINFNANFDCTIDSIARHPDHPKNPGVNVAVRPKQAQPSAFPARKIDELEAAVLASADPVEEFAHVTVISAEDEWA